MQDISGRRFTAEAQRAQRGMAATKVRQAISVAPERGWVYIDAVPRLTPWADICRPFGTRFGRDYLFKIVAAHEDSAN
jgi:hypothetical protein